MNKSILKGTLLGGLSILIFAVLAVGGYKVLHRPKVAEVVAVKEVTETAMTPREECRDIQVRQRAPVNDSNRIAGTVLGGITGGIIGHQFGSGTGNALSTIGGAAGGAYVGNKVQESMQNNDVSTTTRRSCKTVYDKTQKLVGYDVTYRLNDKEGVVRTSFRPGPTLPVEKGQVVTTRPS
ncbi:MAG TPA: glycine zipper 2TM domain-containing protein [Nitrospirota bacterium]|nr:glycine zipper 2TM domain-containing protein [Nitrospirota bacterium]